jgi:hypothetical protein
LFSGDGSTVAFTLSKASTTNGVAVFVENVRQEPTIAYAVSGTTLTFTAAPVTSSGNNIYVLHHNAPASTATHPSAQDLTAVKGTFTGAFTSLGINDDATETAIKITSDEAVGIGTSLTPNNYSGYQSLTIGGGAATTGATVDLEDSSGNLEGRINGTNGVVYIEADPSNSTGTSKISLEVDGTSRMTIDSGGDVDIETGDIFFSTAGKGINLGVTSNTDANTLDDFEEGTFTPAYACTTTANATVNTYNNQDGYYVKVGDMVFCTFRIGTTSMQFDNGQTDNNSAHRMRVTGLPFTSSNTSLTGGGNLYLMSSFGTVTTGITLGVVQNDTQLMMRNQGDTSSYNGNYLDDVYTANFRSHSSGEGNFMHATVYYRAA